MDGWVSAWGVLLIVTESEVHLIYFDTSSKMQPALVTQGDAPVTVRQEKIHVALEKAGTDSDFVRYMISREDLNGNYYDRVFGGKESDSDKDMRVMMICRPEHTLSLSLFLSLSFFLSDMYSLSLVLSSFPSVSLFPISLD